jgi:hypothetical protein
MCAFASGNLREERNLISLAHLAEKLKRHRNMTVQQQDASDSKHASGDERIHENFTEMKCSVLTPSFISNN